MLSVFRGMFLSGDDFSTLFVNDCKSGYWALKEPMIHVMNEVANWNFERV